MLNFHRVPFFVFSKKKKVGICFLVFLRVAKILLKLKEIPDKALSYTKKGYKIVAEITKKKEYESLSIRALLLTDLIY